jgi:hypothetical protein
MPPLRRRASELALYAGSFVNVQIVARLQALKIGPYGCAKGDFVSHPCRSVIFALPTSTTRPQLMSWSVHISCARWVVKICAYNEGVILEGKKAPKKWPPTSVSLVLYIEVVFQSPVGCFS